MTERSRIMALLSDEEAILFRMQAGYFPPRLGHVRLLKLQTKWREILKERTRKTVVVKAA